MVVKYDSRHINLELYAKDNGRCNNINKFELPPPCDKSLYYGSMAIVLSFNDKIEDLTVDLWNKLYEKLYGGFEDITNTKDDDENEVDELKDIPKSEKTKNGYLKDGFVVDNESEDIDSDYEDSENEDNYYESGENSELVEEDYLSSDED